MRELGKEGGTRRDNQDLRSSDLFQTFKASYAIISLAFDCFVT